MATDLTPTPVLAAPAGPQCQVVAMETEHTPETPSIPAGQREPDPDAKKPRLGEPELIIAE